MRPIDADYLRQLLKERTQFVKEDGHPMWAGAFGVAMSFLNKCPTIDAVPVVRCAECDRRDKGFVSTKGTISCPYMEAFMPADGFCSYGDRKDGDGK